MQKRIWLDLGGKLGEYDYDTIKKLGDHVGWRKNGFWLSYGDYTFTTNAQQGHLPCWGKWGWWDGGLKGLLDEITLFSRL